MLVEVDQNSYFNSFPDDPHPFISRGFIELNKQKAENVIHITEESKKPGLGLITGVREGWLLSPFSAPFGGFHFRKEVMNISEIENFLKGLKAFIASSHYKGIKITLPPDIYHQTLNSKLVKSCFQQGYQNEILDITNWVDLQNFQERFSQKNSREAYRQSVRNGLKFSMTDNQNDQEEIYELINQNRRKFGRPIYMTLQDIKNTGEMWPVDYFKVTNNNNELKAAAIIYRSHPQITYALFWGDNDAGRSMRAMDYMSFHLWSYYKKQGYTYMDLGISSESGKPNEGLLRFKENHEAISSLRFKFSWEFTMRI